MSLKTENSRRVAKSRPVCMGLKPSGSPDMATRLTEGTDLNHVNNPVQIKLYCGFLTETFNSIFKILAV